MGRTLEGGPWGKDYDEFERKVGGKEIQRASRRGDPNDRLTVPPAQSEKGAYSCHRLHAALLTVRGELSGGGGGEERL